MSAQASGWVFDKSPYKGALFTLHLAVADIVNDTNGNKLWASVDHLATKARVSERSARAGLGQMVRDGLLELLSTPEGKPRCYRFLMPADPCTHCTPAYSAPLQTDAQTPANERQTPANERETPAVAAPYPNRTQEIPTGSQNLASDIAAARRHEPTDATFDEFWRAYPRKDDVGAARRAWAKATKTADPEVIIAGAHRYADDPTRVPKYTKNPATWLNAGSWMNGPLPQAHTSNGMAASSKRLRSMLPAGSPALTAGGSG